nr:hypothetical protein [Thiocapsa sp. KS1]
METINREVDLTDAQLMASSMWNSARSRPSKPGCSATIGAEIAELEAEASQLAEEIDALTGADDPFGD